MLLYSAPKTLDHIPIVDLGAEDSDSIAQEIQIACRGTGFFYVVNHGVPQDLIDNQFLFAKRFFDLPLEAKLALHMKKSPTTAGYEPTGGQILDSQDDKSEKAPPDLKESFYCGLELVPDDPLLGMKVRGFGHNQWPDLSGFREQMIGYYAALSALGDRLHRLLALSLDMPEPWFKQFHAPAAATLRLIKYPPQPRDAQFNQIGAGAHTDWGGITILAQDSVGGLEVRTVQGDWIKAPPVAGTFVINLGDLMARWTNGLYMSNMHRVNNNTSGVDRYSIPFFYSPYPTSIIEAIPSCIDAGHPRLFETCTAQEHMAEMFRRSYGYTPQARRA
jgi:isopenicillin N synthase-like dioxygenase